MTAPRLVHFFKKGENMLVLSRRQGEKIHVGDAVITLLAIRGNRARIGIEASADVHILRDELPRYETTMQLQPTKVEAVAPQPR